jgi:hypothetical protein
MTRRSVVVTAVVSATVLLVPALLAAAAPAYATPGHDQATGTGTLDQFGNPTAHVNAVATRSGVKGSFTITYPDTTAVSGVAGCLFVSGTTAYVSGRITESSGPRQSGENWFPGNFVVIGVQDNGEPGTAGPDRMNFSPGFATDPGCQPNGAAIPAFPIVAGNYQVVDAP